MAKFGLSFSWKRALGVSAAKGRLSRKLGVPLTRSGRQRRVGRSLGCLVVLAAIGIVGPALLMTACGGDPTRSCSRVCTTGKACGDSCIAANLNCNTPPGSACDAR